VEKSAEYKKLQSENEMLKAEKLKTAYDMEDMISSLNDIYTDIQSLREAENYLTVEPSGELSVDKQTQIKNSVRLISETLQSNRKQLAALEERLKKSDIQSAALQQTIERLNAEINQKALMIASLQEDLAKKDIRIRELDEQVENLLQMSTAQILKISDLDKELHLAYYCFGTKKELKDQAILTGGGLFSKVKALQGNFNRDYFLPVDTRDQTEIQLYARKAKVHSNHPVNSYTYTKDQNGNLTLMVIEPELFWSLSKYLVIEVG
jgi:predicted  nucleic acid-binding Zn-ribbon protein